MKCRSARLDWGQAVSSLLRLDWPERVRTWTQSPTVDGTVSVKIEIILARDP